MIARRSLLIVGSQFFARFLGWIAIVILAKLWGNFAPETLGVIGFAMAFVMLFDPISHLGFNVAHVKRISEGQDLGFCMGTFISVKIFLTTLMVGIIFLTMFIAENVLNKPFFDTTTGSIVIIFIFYFILISFSQIPISTFEAKKEIVKRQFTIITENLVKVPFLITVAVVGAGVLIWTELFKVWAIKFLALAYLCGALMMFFVGMWLLRKYPFKKPNWKLFKSYFKFAIPVMILSIFTAVSINVDKVMIGYYWNLTEVGYYFTVQQILQIILIFSAAIGIVLFPTISEYHSKKDYKKIKQTTHSAMRYISMTMIPIVVLIIVFASPFINILLSNAFLPATSVLIVLSVLAFISALGTPYSSLITGVDRPGIAAKIGIIMCILNVILNVMFIPKNGLLSFVGISGALGAAVATMLSCFVGFIGLLLAAKKLTGIKILQKHIFYHIIAGTIMGVGLYISTLFISTIYWYYLVGFVGLGLLIYIGLLVIMKEFTKQDLHFFLDLIHPKEMFKYMAGEFKK